MCINRVLLLPSFPILKRIHLKQIIIADLTRIIKVLFVLTLEESYDNIDGCNILYLAFLFLNFTILRCVIYAFCQSLGRGIFNTAGKKSIYAPVHVLQSISIDLSINPSFICLYNYVTYTIQFTYTIQ